MLSAITDWLTTREMDKAARCPMAYIYKRSLLDVVLAVQWFAANGRHVDAYKMRATFIALRSKHDAQRLATYLLEF